MSVIFLYSTTFVSSVNVPAGQAAAEKVQFADPRGLYVLAAQSEHSVAPPALKRPNAQPARIGKLYFLCRSLPRRRVHIGEAGRLVH